MEELVTKNNGIKKLKVMNKYYDPVKYWNERIKLYGFVNTRATEITAMEYDFCHKYINNGDKVLDYGVGDGKLFPVYQEKQCEVIGYDIANWLTYEHCKDYNFPFKYLLSNTVRILTEFENKSFDVVVCFGVLLHVRPDDIVMMINDISRLGKKCIFTTHSDLNAVKIDENTNINKHCFNHDYELIFKKLDVIPELYEYVADTTLLIVI